MVRIRKYCCEISDLLFPCKSLVEVVTFIELIDQHALATLLQCSMSCYCIYNQHLAAFRGQGALQIVEGLDCTRIVTILHPYDVFIAHPELLLNVLLEVCAFFFCTG